MDVLIIGDVKFSEAVLALSSAEERLRREVNPSVYSKAELRAKLKERNAYLDRVLAGPKLYLIGGDDDLAQLVEHRKAQAA